MWILHQTENLKRNTWVGAVAFETFHNGTASSTTGGLFFERVKTSNFVHILKYDHIVYIDTFISDSIYDFVGGKHVRAVYSELEV